MEKNEKSKKRKIFDKVIMGAVVGGAIGSVVGASLSPNKKDDKNGEKPKSVLKKLFGLIGRKKHQVRKIPNEQ